MALKEAPLPGMPIRDCKVKYELTDRIPQLLDKLLQWRRKWDETYPDCFWETSPNPLKEENSRTSLSAGCPFKKVYYFHDMWLACEFCVHNMAVILALLLFLHVFGHQYPGVQTPVGAALDICRCMEYLCNPVNGSRGFLEGIFPAMIAYQVLDPQSAEAAWLLDTCCENAATSGFRFGSVALKKKTVVGDWIRGMMTLSDDRAAALETWLNTTSQQNLKSIALA